MTATVEETQADLKKLLNLVQQGEEVVITSQGQPVAKLSAVPKSGPSPDLMEWVKQLRELRERCSTGKTGPTVEQILDEDRGD